MHTATNMAHGEARTRGGMGGLLRAAGISFLMLTLLTGVLYPMVMTGLAHAMFPHQAEGSLIDGNGRPASGEATAVGSALIGQSFDQPQYFWSRPSATTPGPYNAASSSGSNMGPSAMAPVVEGRVEALRKADPGQVAPVPVDLVTASGSGLDPHLSVAAALYQVPRIARARGVERSRVELLVREHTEEPALGLFGERVVNVVELNLSMDQVAPLRPVPGTAR